jgi:hypothetical protein
MTAWRTEQLGYLGTAQVRALSTCNLQALTAEQLGYGFTTSKSLRSAAASWSA